MASINFDASAVDTSILDPVDAGTYEAVVSDTQVKPTKNGVGKGLNIRFEIVSGPAKGRTVWNWINFQHSNPVAQSRGQADLAKLCKAVGVVRLTETTQLHNIPLVITVGFDKDDKTKNVVTAYEKKADTSPWNR